MRIGKAVSRLILGAGVSFACGLFAWNTRSDALAVLYRLRGITTCTWRQTLAAPAQNRLRAKLRNRARQDVALIKNQGNLLFFSGPRRPFWIPFAGSTEEETWALLSDLIAEQAWQEANRQAVRPGDVVLDCRARIGQFTDLALSHGAAKVVAIEPDPQQLECLRRNFAREIAQGRVVVSPTGGWPVTTIDAIVSDLRLSRVDYIRTDLDGAERDALRGAMGVLQQYKPRLMIATHHRRDDVVVIRRLVAQGNPSYIEECGPCEQSAFLPPYALVPHVVWFH